MNSRKTSRTANFEVAAAKCSSFQSPMPPQLRTSRNTTKRTAGIRSRPPLAPMLQLHQQIQAVRAEFIALGLSDQYQKLK